MKNYKKTEHFEPIAMKCNKEQFNELKPILDEFKISLGYVEFFNTYPYLFNHFIIKADKTIVVTNRCLSSVTNEIVYNEFNAEIFLKACGIVEVEKTYQLSETFVKELCKEPNILEAFVREGIIEDDKLEVGKWYKWTENEISVKFKITELEKYTIRGYGFRDDIYIEEKIFYSGVKNYNDAVSNLKEMTPQEVETALINEAKKRGVEKGKIKQIKELYQIETSKEYYLIKLGVLYYKGIPIFYNGTWAEIIKPETYVKIPQSLIDNTPNDLELGGLVRNFKEYK